MGYVSWQGSTHALYLYLACNECRLCTARIWCDYWSEIKLSRKSAVAFIGRISHIKLLTSSVPENIYAQASKNNYVVTTKEYAIFEKWLKHQINLILVAPSITISHISQDIWNFAKYRIRRIFVLVSFVRVICRADSVCWQIYENIRILNYGARLRRRNYPQV